MGLCCSGLNIPLIRHAATPSPRRGEKGTSVIAKRCSEMMRGLKFNEYFWREDYISNRSFSLLDNTTSTSAMYLSVSF